jgi:hypothetical protein
VGQNEPAEVGQILVAVDTKAAAKAGMDEKTARKYHKLGGLPSPTEKLRGLTPHEYIHDNPPDTPDSLLLTG